MTEHTGARMVPGGHFVVPGNRWDLLDGVEPTRPPTVSVVIAYFEAQADLDLVLAALSEQRYPPGRLEVIVADDGSTVPPCLDQMPGARTVRQDDLGFRAAAARNLGAAAATGEILVFLDGDTVPEPDYLRRLVRLPALLPDALVVGRRRHADFGPWSPGDIRAWARGAGPGPAELPEPQWLRCEYRRTGDLRDIGPQSYRYVISAVLACSRRLFDEVGGFDATMIGYGGEDWDLAHRALCAGAVLAHVPTAVAWHDGPDWAERGAPGERRRAKNAETAALAHRIPEPLGAGPGAGPAIWTGRPNVVAILSITGAETAAVIVGVRSLLGAPTSCGVWLTGPDADAVWRTEFAADPRIAVGPPPRAATDRARVRLHLSRPLIIAPSGWRTLLGPLIADGVGRVRVTTADGVLDALASGALRRAERWRDALDTAGADLAGADLVHQLFGTLDLDAERAGVRPVPRHPDLAHELEHLADQPD